MLVTRRFDDPAADAADLMVRLGVAVLAIVLPCGAVLSRRLVFVAMPVGAVLILIGMAFAPGDGALRRVRDAFMTRMGAATLFLLAWAALSVVWTPFHATAAERLAKTAGTLLLAIAVAAALPPRTRTSNLYLLPIGLAAAAVAALAVVLFGPDSLVAPTPDLEASTIDRVSLTLVILVWPALAALAVRERWDAACALAVVVACAALAVWTPIALAALVAGGIVYAVASFHPARAARGLGLLAAALFLGAPLVPLAAQVLGLGRSGSSPPWLASLLVWADIVKHDNLRLITGHGLDTVVRGAPQGLLPTPVPGSFLFELWYELGIIGVLAAAALAFGAFRAAGRATPRAAPFLMAGLTCGLAASAIGIASSQLWWLTLLAVAGLDFALVAKGQYRTVRPVLRQFSEAPPQVAE